VEGGRGGVVHKGPRDDGEAGERRAGEEGVLAGCDVLLREDEDAAATAGFLSRCVFHPRVDARRSPKSIPQIYRGIDVKRRFQLPLT
jgi:hypothetical protein